MPNPQNPLVSVITVVHNSLSSIEQTIISVKNQTYSNIEFLVLDGDSIDGTKNIISKYSDLISFYSSEKDKGIYDAMNKGIINANGEWLFFLNSGDIFYDNFVIEDIFLDSNLLQCDLLCGNVVVNEKMELIKSCHTISKYYFYNRTICHQSVFFHKDAFLINGLYNINYKIIADREWFYRASLINLNFKFIDRTICLWEESGYSTSNKNIYINEESHFRLLSFSIYELFFLKIWHRLIR